MKKKRAKQLWFFKEDHLVWRIISFVLIGTPILYIVSLLILTKIQSQRMYTPIVATLPEYPSAKSVETKYRGANLIDNDVSAVITYTTHDKDAVTYDYYKNALTSQGWRFSWGYIPTDEDMIKNHLDKRSAYSSYLLYKDNKTYKLSIFMIEEENLPTSVKLHLNDNRVVH